MRVLITGYGGSLAPYAVERTQNVGSPCAVHIGSSIRNPADRGLMDDMVGTKPDYDLPDRRDVVHINKLNFVLASAWAMVGSQFFRRRAEPISQGCRNGDLAQCRRVLNREPRCSPQQTLSDILDYHRQSAT